MFKTELSDFHKLVVTVLKFAFPISPPKIITYGSYDSFSNKLLREDLNSLLGKENMTLEFTSLTSFTKLFIETFNKHAWQRKNMFVQTTQTLLKKVSNNAKI